MLNLALEQSFSDGPVASSSGKLYFYVSDLDASAQDLAVDSKCSLSLSLQMLGDYCTKEVRLPLM